MLMKPTMSSEIHFTSSVWLLWSLSSRWRRWSLRSLRTVNFTGSSATLHTSNTNINHQLHSEDQRRKEKNFFFKLMQNKRNIMQCTSNSENDKFKLCNRTPAGPSKRLQGSNAWNHINVEVSAESRNAPKPGHMHPQTQSHHNNLLTSFGKQDQRPAPSSYLTTHEDSSGNWKWNSHPVPSWHPRP